MRAFGIDVSSVQGTINFDTVSKQGLTFAVCKATSGIGHDLDPFFSRNMAGLRKAGLLCSLYHWWVWTRDPKEQAANVEWAANLAGGTDFSVAIDFESPAPEKWQEKGCNPWGMVENLVDMADDVKRRLGRAPVIYTYPWFMSSIRAPYRNVPKDLLDRLAGFELWAAAGPRYAQAWTPTDQDDPPSIPPWTAWKLWQYSGNGGKPLPGIFGDVDRNVFNGTPEECKAWAGIRTIPPETEKHAAIDLIQRISKT